MGCIVVILEHYCLHIVIVFIHLQNLLNDVVANETYITVMSLFVHSYEWILEKLPAVDQ